MARPGGYRSVNACGLRSRTAAGCEGEAVVWDLRRRVRSVAASSPRNEHGFFTALVGTRKAGVMATEGRDVQQLVAGRTGKGRPVRVTSRTKARKPST